MTARASACLVLALALASFAHAQVVLTPNIPFNDSVARQQYKDYVVIIPPAPASGPDLPLTVAVTPVGGGDPDLFINLNGLPPRQGSALYQARGFGNDSITVASFGEPRAANATISVYGWQAVASYVIVATFDGVIELNDGQQLADDLPVEATAYFSFNAGPPSAGTNVTFIMTPVSGRGQLMVSNSATLPVFQNRSTWTWSSRTRPIIVRGSDPAWPADNIFRIGVYALSVFSYTLSASTGNLELIDGVPVLDHIETGESEYFMFNNVFEGCVVEFIITPQTGDPDLYVARNVSHPAWYNAEKSSTGSGGVVDRVVYENAPTGIYYLTVAAFQNSTFTVLGYADCESGTVAITLIDGQPQSGVLVARDYRYYELQTAPNHLDITISVSRFYGDPDLYVLALPLGHENDDVWPTLTNYTWRAAVFGEDHLTILHVDPNFCSGCVYRIGVYAFNNCSYLLTAATNDVPIRLMDGVPVREDLQAGEAEYFELYVENSQQDFSIYVTDLGVGDPDLYVSTKCHRPNATCNEWQASRPHGDSITIPHTDPLACGACTYYVAVYAASATTFVVVASYENYTSLLDGVPQQGVVAKEAIVEYAFVVEGAIGQDVTITLTVLSGLAEMWVSKTREPDLNVTSHEWSTRFFTATQTIEIDQDDQKRCTADLCTYYIGVHGVTNATFTILVATTEATIPLQNGIPQQEHVETNGWEYFSFRLDQPGLDLAFVATPLTGDPDLYLSLPGPNQTTRPNETTADLKHTAYGADIIDVPNATLGTYYIGVNAYRNTTFTILVMVFSPNDTSPNTRVVVQDGQPQTGVVEVHTYRYYSLQLLGTTNSTVLTISLVRLWGDPDLYVNDNGVLPNASNARYSSNSFRDDYIVVPASSVHDGEWLIGVYGYTSAAFTLTAASTVMRSLLQDSVPVQGDVPAGGSTTYGLYVDSFNKQITISLTPLDGAAFLYVSWNDTTPDNSSYQWKSEDRRGAAVSIAPDDPNFCQRWPRCLYFITVYGSTNAIFTLTASFSTAVSLVNGQPMAGVVTRNAFVYYTYQVAVEGDKEVSVTVTPQVGMPIVYVKASHVMAQPDFPTTTDYTWKSEDYYTGAPLRVPADHPDACVDQFCVYYIGVFGRTNCSYTIIVRNNEVNYQLQDGIPVTASVMRGDYNYFVYGISRPGLELSIFLTALTGDPDLYVSFVDDHPSTESFNWSSTYTGADLVVIDNATVGNYYIAVRAYLNSTFTVTAYVDDLNSVSQTISLVNGRPQNGRVSAARYRYYSFQLNELHSDATILLTRRVGDPDMYMTVNGSTPSKSVWQWKADTFGGDMITVHHPPMGTYLIAVYGANSADFTLTASTTDQIVSLQDGRPLREDLREKEYEYFVIAVDRLDQDLTVTVTAVAGDPDLYISTIYERPNLTNSEWRALSSTLVDSITIPASRLNLTNYYIAVHAFHNCSFTILASFSNSTELLDGVPQADQVVFEQSVYYTFPVDPTLNMSDVSFVLTPSIGNAYLYVSATEQPIRFQRRTYQFSSTNSASTQTVRVDNSSQYFNTSVWYVMAYGVTNCSYTLMATTSHGAILLTTDVPQRSWADAGRYEYFYFQLLSSFESLTLTVTPITGDPDLYLSRNLTERPTNLQGNYQWASARWGADSITLRGDDLGVGETYFAGVYAFTNSTFTITLVLSGGNESLLLVPGVAQFDRMDRQGTYRYYKFMPTIDPTIPVYARGHNSRPDITFVVNPTLNDPDIYVRNDNQLPNMSFWQWQGSDLGRDEVTISPDMDGYCVNCVYEIAVYAWAAPVQYTLTAKTSQSIVTLGNGQSVVERIASGEYSFFHVVMDTNGGLVITVTPFSGDPDLYVNDEDHDHYPNSTNAQYMAYSWGADTIVIHNASAGTDFYIAVYAPEYFTTFSIVASVDLSENAVMLVSGEPMADHLAAGASRLYYLNVYDADQSQDITITVSPLTGSVDLFVLNDTSSVPNATHFTWSTRQASRISGVIFIPRGQSCSDCTFLVSAYANSASDFLLSYQTSTGAPDSESTILVAGQPVQGSVPQGQARYFRVAIDSNTSDVVIGVTLFSGVVDVFASMTDSRPNATSLWKSVNSPADSITISHTDPNLVIGTLYVAVVGTRESTFSIVVSQRNTLLRDGYPQTAVSVATGNFFEFRVDLTMRPAFTVSASAPNRGDVNFTVSVYASSATASAPVTEPNSTVNTWTAQLSSASPLLLISAEDPKYCTTCSIFYIGVVASVANIPISVSASSNNSFRVLADSSSIRDTVAPHTFLYFEMPITLTYNYSVTLEPCDGAADLYLSSSGRPTTGSFDAYASASNEPAVITANNLVTNAQLWVGAYGTLASQGEVEFVLRSSIGSTRQPGPRVDDPGVSLLTPKRGAVVVSFQPASSTSSLSYQVYYAKRADHAVMYTACGVQKRGMRGGAALNVPGTQTDPLSVTVEGLDVGVDYEFNVLVTDANGLVSIYRQSIIRTLSSDVGDEQQATILKWVLRVGIPAFVIIVALVIYLYVRNRKLSKELEVEMHDVPKAAVRKAVRGPAAAAAAGGKNPKNYSRLLNEAEEEEEDDGVGVEYDPPKE